LILPASGWNLSSVELLRANHSFSRRRKKGLLQQDARVHEEDVEWYFGILQGRFGIIAHPSKLWSSTIMANIMYACIIMHNMIFEDESSKENLEPLFEVEAPTDFTRPLSFEALVVGTKQLESIDQHYSMRGDLVEHLWTLKGLSTY
jgi:hypothetical protein